MYASCDYQPQVLQLCDVTKQGNFPRIYIRGKFALVGSKCMLYTYQAWRNSYPESNLSRKGWDLSTRLNSYAAGNSHKFLEFLHASRGNARHRRKEQTSHSPTIKGYPFPETEVRTRFWESTYRGTTISTTSQQILQFFPFWFDVECESNAIMINTRFIRKRFLH